MNSISFRSFFIRTGACALLACVSTTAFANFKYIPASNAGEASAGPSVTSSPLSEAPMNAPASQASAQSPVRALSGGEIISGFGTQVPLVMALREIVPTSYQFAFAEGLNLGTLVNWKGGRPWRNVLRGVVTQVGLTATERNSVIYIDRQDTGQDTGMIAR